MIVEVPCPQRPSSMLPTEELFVYVYVLVHDLMLAGAVVVPGRPGPSPACSDAELLAIAVVRHLLGRAASPGSWPRSAGTGGTCSRRCRARARPTGAPAGCGARSSSCGSRWRPGSPKTTASRSTPAPCRSSTRPGSAARTSGPPRQRPSRPVRPRRRPRRVVLRLPARRQDRPGQPDRARLGIVPAAVSERDVAEDLLAAGPSRVTCSPTRASAAGPSPPPRPPAAPPSSSRPARSSARPCPPSC